LFEVKQTYMFAVFEKTLLTDQGKAYVREFEKTSDAQSIYRRIFISYYSLHHTIRISKFKFEIQILKLEVIQVAGINVRVGRLQQQLLVPGRPPHHHGRGLPCPVPGSVWGTF
jgi:hypothetical protein